MRLQILRPKLIIPSPETIGDIFINGVWWCYSLEDEVRPNGVKIPGKTAIPAGVYPLIVDYSNRFKRELPRLLNVKNFTGVRVHGGCRPEDTEGCILAGKERGRQTIWNCESAVEGIIAAIKKDTSSVVEIL